MQKTFPAEAIRRLIIADIAGELVVRGWEDRTISVESENQVATLRLEGENLIIGGAVDGVIIAVPYETAIQAMRISDDISIINVSQVELHEAGSDCFLKGIHGEVSLGRIHGELSVEDVRALRLVDRVDGDAAFVDVEALKTVSVGGDVQCKNIHEAQFQHSIGGELEVENVDILHAGNVGRDCVIRGNGHTVVNLANVGGDLEAHGITKLHAQNIGVNCEIHDSAQAEVVLGNVGNELEVSGVLSINVQNVGRECELRDIQGNVSVKHIGTNMHVAGVGGGLRLGHVGAQADISGVLGRVVLGHIGGNLRLQASFPAESVTNVYVGGNATLDLSDAANVTIQAVAGGNVRDETSGMTYHNRALLVYGEGAAQLKVKAGGNVNMRGAVVVESETTGTGENNWGWKEWGWKDWDWKDWQFAYNTNEWNGEMGGMVSTGDNREWKRQQRMEAQKRRVEGQSRRAEERARGARLNIRFKEREWRVDPAHIDHIVEQARRAAADGIQGAFEAVDQALKNMQLSTPVPPYPPYPPYPPAPPHPAAGPVVPPVPPYPGEPAASDSRDTFHEDDDIVEPDSEEIEAALPGSSDLEEGNDEYQEQPIEDEKAPVDIEQEREAILRMIVEGRITPDEGDMLLEALN